MDSGSLSEAVAAARAAEASGDLDRAVSAWDVAVERLTAEVGDEIRALILDSAARARLRRLWAGDGPPADLDAAVNLWRKSAAAGAGCAILSNLGLALRELWERDGDSVVLDEAVEAGRAAVAADASSDADRMAARLQLGKSLRERFRLSRRRDDLDDAITVLRETDGTDADAQEALGNALFDRYEVAGAAIDQKRAIECLRRAVDLAGEPAYRSNLASALLDRFESGGDGADLDDAVTLLHDALADTDDPSSLLLSNYGNALRLRAEHASSVADAERAIALLTDAVDRERKPGLLSNLAAALLQRFELTGLIADVDKAATLLEEAVKAAPHDDPARPARLSNLGSALRKRQLRRRSGREDLDRAVEVFDEAVALTADERPTAAAYHANLGNALQQRYDVTQDSRDLDRAIDELEHALGLTPAASADRPGYLNNLGAALAARSGGDDLDRSVVLTREAVARAPESSSQRPTFLVNLANAVSERFARLGGPDDLAAGRDAYRAALRTGLTTSPAEALAAARNWAEWARDRRDWPDVTEAFRLGEQAAHRLFESQLLRADKESWLRDAEGLVADGAYAFAARSEPREAAAALERGRALLLSERLDRGAADIERLDERRPDLARRFRATAARARAPLFE